MRGLVERQSALAVCACACTTLVANAKMCVAYERTNDDLHTHHFQQTRVVDGVVDAGIARKNIWPGIKIALTNTRQLETASPFMLGSRHPAPRCV